MTTKCSRGLLLLAAIQCLWLSGCIAFYKNYPVKVRVVDAETEAPIPKAGVHVRYYLFFTLNQPQEAPEATTDSEGYVRISVASVHEGSSYGRDYSVAAEGYVFDDPSDDEKIPSPTFVVHLYREPQAKITIVVPDGYRGLLRLETKPIPKWTQGEIGQRQFIFHASADGFVRIDATPMLVELNWVTVRYENGVVLPETDAWTKNVRAPQGIALRHMRDGYTREIWKGHAGFRRLFVIGTQRDADDATTAIWWRHPGVPFSGMPFSGHDSFADDQADFDAVFERR